MTRPTDPPALDFFVGIDSDGCVFDTMEVKHKDCFIPRIVEHYGLAAVARHFREVAEFLNLYSRWRGINRFPGLVMAVDLLADHPAMVGRPIALPALAGLRAWLATETRLGNPALAAAAARSGDPDLAAALAWSEAVNRTIAATVRDVPPFPLVSECLDTLRGRAEVVVVSATPGEALEREWVEHGLRDRVRRIAGQEAGSKAEVLAQAIEQGGCGSDRALMIGDAPADLAAARTAGALFYPIEPGFEVESWSDLLHEGLPRFFEGTFAGPYMAERVDRFLGLLPEVPPWKRA